MAPRSVFLGLPDKGWLYSHPPFTLWGLGDYKSSLKNMQDWGIVCMHLPGLDGFKINFGHSFRWGHRTLRKQEIQSKPTPHSAKGFSSKSRDLSSVQHAFLFLGWLHNGTSPCYNKNTVCFSLCPKLPALELHWTSQYQVLLLQLWPKTWYTLKPVYLLTQVLAGGMLVVPVNTGRHLVPPIPLLNLG